MRTNNLITEKKAKTLSLAFGSLGIALGYMLRGAVNEKWHNIYEDPITVQQALNYLDCMGSTHQYFVDHPSDCSNTIGGVKFHEEYVKRYNQLYNLIEGLSK